MFDNPGKSEIDAFLRRIRTVVILGLSETPGRPSYNVAKGLQKFGLRIILEDPAATESRQNRVRFFALHDRLDHLRRDWLDVRAISKFRIGHDGSWVRIHQHDLVAFFAQRLARLHPGIIKFAALPDHDWTGADEKNFFELVIPRHLPRRR